MTQNSIIKTKTYSANSMWFAHKNFKRTVTAESSTYWTENNTYSDMAIKCALWPVFGSEYKTVITINREILPTQISNATLRLATKSNASVSVGTQTFTAVANEQFDVDITDMLEQDQVDVEITGGSETEPTFLHTTGDLAPSLELTYVASEPRDVVATLYSVNRTLGMQQATQATVDDTTFVLCKLENLANQDLSKSTKVIARFPVLHVEGSQFYRVPATATGTHEVMFDSPTANMVQEIDLLYYIADVTPLINGDTVYFAVERCNGDTITLGSPEIQLYQIASKEVSSEGASIQHSVGARSAYAVSLFDGRMNFSQHLFSAHGQLSPLQLSMNYHMVRGWRFSVEQEVVPHFSHFSWIDGSNKEHVFVRSKNNNSVYVDSTGKTGLTLSHLSNGYEIVDGKGTTLLFNSDGKLYKIQQKVGASQYVSTNISYQNGKVSQVVDGMGTTYVWGYSADICSIKKGSDTLCTVHYNAEQQIVQVAYPSGISSTFVYAINGLLKSVKDSSTSKLVEFDYDGMCSVVSIKQSVQKNAEKLPTQSYFLSYSLFEEGTTKQLFTTVDYCKNTFDADEKYMCKRFDFSTDGVLLFAGNPDQSGRMIVLNKEDYSSHFATLDDEPSVFLFSQSPPSTAVDLPITQFAGGLSGLVTVEANGKSTSKYVFAATVDVTKPMFTDKPITVSLYKEFSENPLYTIVVDPSIAGMRTFHLDVELNTSKKANYKVMVGCMEEGVSARVQDICLFKVNQPNNLQMTTANTGLECKYQLTSTDPVSWYKMTNCTITCGEHIAEDAKFTTKDYLLTLCSKMANANFFNVWYNDGSQCFVGVGNATFTFNNGTISTLGNIMVADVSTQHKLTSLQYATLEDDGLYVHNQVHNGTKFQQSYSKMDDLFRTVKTEDGNGVVTEYVFDAFSNVTKQSTYHKDTPSNAIKWETVHSADGKLATADKSFYLLDTHTTSYAYNADSMLQSVTEPNGQEYSYTYDTDKTHQVKVESTLDNKTHQTGVNLQSGVCQSMYDSNNTYYFGYDQRNNVATVSTNGVTLLSKQHTYLPNGGEQILSTFANGYKQRNTYNSFGKLILAEDVTNATAVPLVAYIYSDVALDETNSEISSPTDSSLVVSESSKLRKVIDYASGKTSFYVYDQNGELRCTTDGLVTTVIIEKDGYNRTTKAGIICGEQYNIDFAYNYKSPFDSTLIEESAETKDKTFTTTYTTDTLQRPTETQVLVGVNGYKTIYYYAPQKEQHWVEADGTVRPTSDASLQYVPGDSAIGGEGYWETRNIGTTPKIASVSRYKITNGVPSNESFENIVYDANGNITQCGGTTYVYDKLNRLVRENNSTLDKTFVWCYDTSGNILSRTEYDYTTGDLTNVAPTATFAYTYDTGWKDQLVSFNGQSIACDQSGNPTTYRGASLSWTRGRLLASYNSITMQYNANGIRTKKVVPGTNYSTTTEYVYSGNNLLQEKVTRAGISQSSTTYRTYLYNSQGVMGFVQDGAEYIYHKNIFGDIVAIYQGATKVAEYIYDAWGNHKVLDGNSVEVTDPAHIAHQNPFRYRGYFWDSDLQLYYIQGRYYDPQIGRFINVDSLEHLDPVSIGGINLCTYARNNPVGITYVTSKESNSDRESNFIVNSIVGHISSANSNKIDAFFTTENTSELILGVTDASLTIRGLYTSIANLTNHISYFIKNLRPFSLDMRLNGTPMNKAVLAFNNFNWGLDKASVFGVVFSVGLDILDSLHRGVSAEGVVLGAALTAAKGILLIYVNKSIIYLATTIGGMFGVVGAVVGYVIGALICIAVDTYVSRQLDNEIDRIAK